MIITSSILSFIWADGQQLYSLHTQWDDEITQWRVVMNEGELEGSIQMRWRLKQDVTLWDFEFDGIRGTIGQQWDNNPNRWELRSGNTIVEITTVWRGDFTAYRVSDGSKTFQIERKHFAADPVEWSLSGENEEDFYWYNEFQNDFRDWVIIDNLSDEYSTEAKLAAVFISILNLLILR